MLESYFIPGDERIGSLAKPLCGLILHMSDGGPESSPSESAWVGVPKDPSSRVPKVKVYVSPSSLNTMMRVYAPLGPNISVEPLYFTEDELDAQAFLSMMAVGSSDSAPLYVQIILVIMTSTRGTIDKIDALLTLFSPFYESWESNIVTKLSKSSSRRSGRTSTLRKKPV